MHRVKIYTSFLFFFFVNTCLISNSQSQQLAPPKFDVTDELGVNIHSGQVTTSLETVSIGGALGLSHNIQSHSSNFLVRNTGGATTGLHDKFNGSARFTKVLDSGDAFYNVDPYTAGTTSPHFTDFDNGIYVMKVHDFEGSADFKYMLGQRAVGNPNAGVVGSYTFEAVGDKRHKLTTSSESPGYLIWTKPNGAQSWFWLGSATSTIMSNGYLEKVVYPNGYTINISRSSSAPGYPASVWTNTGFQIKYNYLFKSTITQGIGGSNTSTEYNPPANDVTWSRQNPFSVVAINRSIESCSFQSNNLCVGAQEGCPSLSAQEGQSCLVLTKQWRSAKFIWPAGMPRAFYFGENNFSIVDSLNGTTNYRVKAFDKYADENGNPISPGYPVGQAFVPRLVGVKPANSSAETIGYTYTNYVTGATKFGVFLVSMPGESGMISSATSINGNGAYPVGHQPSQNPSTWARSGKNLKVEMRSDLLGGLISVTSLRGVMSYAGNWRNFPESFANNSGPTETYNYDSRGNLRKIIYQSGTSEESFIEASFPGTCANQKTCNQADWVADAKGNKTYYTYHAASGQVATITYPPNKNGKTAQTRFYYTQKYANYFNSNGVKTQADTPIWLKTQERYCINSNPSGDSCAGGATDEVITGYEYNSDNLFLTGMTVTAMNSAGQIITKRTCYQYDQYGNKIGETTPRGLCGQ